MNVKEKYIQIKYVMRADCPNIYIEKFNENHILVYAAIQRYRGIRGDINCTLEWIYNDWGIKSKALQTELRQAYIDLKEFELIEFENDVSGITKNSKLNCFINIDEDGDYKEFQDSEIDKIRLSAYDIRSKKVMLFLFADIVSRIDTKNYCYPSTESFKTDLQTKNHGTVSDNLARLKELELIDYGNSGTIITKQGKVEKGNNIYVRCFTEGYEQILESAIQGRTDKLIQEKNKVIKKKEANKKRSESMKEYHATKDTVEEKVDVVEQPDKVETVQKSKNDVMGVEECDVNKKIKNIEQLRYKVEYHLEFTLTSSMQKKLKEMVEKEGLQTVSMAWDNARDSFRTSTYNFADDSHKFNGWNKFVSVKGLEKAKDYIKRQKKDYGVDISSKVEITGDIEAQFKANCELFAKENGISINDIDLFFKEFREEDMQQIKKQNTTLETLGLNKNIISNSDSADNLFIESLNMSIS